MEPEQNDTTIAGRMEKLDELNEALEVMEKATNSYTSDLREFLRTYSSPEDTELLRVPLYNEDNPGESALERMADIFSNLDLVVKRLADRCDELEK